MLFRNSASSLPRALFLTLVSLPAVSFSAEIGGTTVATDTTLSGSNTWDGANGNLTINDAAVLTIENGASVIFTPDNNRDILSNSTGSLQIDAGGLFSHATTTGGDNLLLTGAIDILNNGTYEFASGGDFRLVNNGSSFTNNGLILKSAATVGSSNDPAYIFQGTSSSGGTFLNTGDITVTTGHLNIAGGSSTGGNFTGSGGLLSFSGKWAELTGVATGSVIISAENPDSTTGGKFIADAPTTSINVTGEGLRLGSSSSPAVVLDLNGNILRNDGLLRMTESTATTTVQGAGSFENSATGTFELQAGTLALTTSDLTNNGLLAISTGSITVSGPGSIVNSAAGTITLNGNGVLVADTAVTNNGQMTISGTSSIAGSVAVTNSSTGLLSFGGGATSLTLNGNNLVNDGIADFSSDGIVTLTGSGRFINNNTFNHNYGGGGDNLVITDSATFENNGTYDFKKHGDINITSNGVFENNGLLVKSVAGSDSSYIFNGANTLATAFIAKAGSEVRSEAGTLYLATGGTSDAAATWTANGGTLGISGQWSGTITGTSVDASGKIRIQGSGNGVVASNLAIGTGGLVLDVSAQGVAWSSAEIKTQGNTLSNIGEFYIAGAGAKTLSGSGGELLNASGGSLYHLDGTVTFADGAVLRNQGSMEIALNGDSAYAGTGSIISEAGATLSWTGAGIDVGTDIQFHNQGTMTISGSSHTLTGTGLFANDAGGITNWTDSSSITIEAGATYTNNGTFNVENTANRSFLGTGTFVNNATFNQNVTNTGGDNVSWDGAGEYINNGLHVLNGNSDFNLEGDSTFTNSANAKIQVNAPGTSDQAQFFTLTGNGGGTLDNQGTIEVLSGHFRVTTSLSGSAQFDDVVLAQNNGTGTLTGGTWIAKPATSGTAIIDLEPFGNSTGITTIGTNAVVELTGAGASLTQLSSLTQIDGGLHINEKTFTPGGALVVGSAGTLGGNGTIANSTTVAGTLTPGDTRGNGIGALSVTGNLGLTTSSTLNLQLSAALGVENSSNNPMTTRMNIDALPDMDPTTEHDSLEISGILTLSNMMSIQVIDAGMTYAYGQYFDLLDFDSLAGITTQEEADAILNLPNLGPAYSWDTSLFVSKGIVFVIPEPSTALLAALGSLALLRRKR